MSVLAIAEHRRGELRDMSYELLTAGRSLADATDGDLHVAVVSGDVDTYADKLNRDDVDAIHTVDHGEEFNHDVYVQAVEQLVDSVDPTYVLAPNSVNGLDYVPALAQRLDYPLVTDAVGFDVDEGLTVTRELYGGKTEATIEVAGDRAVLTIRGGEWPAAEGTGEAEISAFDADIDESAVRSTVTGYQEVGAGDVDITDADVLVSIGRGKRKRTSTLSTTWPTHWVPPSQRPAQSSTTTGSRRTDRSASPARSSPPTCTSLSASPGLSSTSPG
jgi:electron transfer flavoprotein alpha subunit